MFDIDGCLNEFVCNCLSVCAMKVGQDNSTPIFEFESCMWFCFENWWLWMCLSLHMQGLVFDGLL
jgi:hypothetical protein